MTFSITKSFGEKRVLDGVTVDIPEKGLLLLTGASGSGKTTLLRCVAGLTETDQGRLSVGRVSFAFQEHRLFDRLSALSNLTKIVDPPIDEKKAAETLIALGLKEEDLHTSAARLSGGMAQRVSLARAFLSPGILLLDEPTKELDEHSASLVVAEIRKQAETRPVIVSTHEPELFRESVVSEIKL